MADDHFTFLGYREYELTTEDGVDVLRGVPGHRPRRARGQPGARPTPVRLADLPAGVADRLRTPRLLIVTKAAARSTVHRPDYLEYVGVKVIDDDGRVTGERHVVGLWTALSYRASAMDIPFLRAKIDGVLDARRACRRTATTPASCWNILETFPRDDLFQISTDELLRDLDGHLEPAGAQAGPAVRST